MKWILRLILLGALAATAFWLWTVLFPSPDKVVLKKLSRLAQEATFGSDDSNLVRASKASSVISYFAADTQVFVVLEGVGSRVFAGRDELREAVMGGAVNFPSLDVKFVDATARVAADKQTVDVNCTAEVKLARQKEVGVQELRFEFKKIEGEWRISRLEPVKTLQ